MSDIEALTMGSPRPQLGSCVTEDMKWNKKLMNISEAMYDVGNGTLSCSCDTHLRQSSLQHVLAHLGHLCCSHIHENVKNG